MNKSQSQQEVYKIILVGDQGVGKSSILLRYTKDLFNREYNVTIGLEFASKKVTVYDYALTLQIWDTVMMQYFKFLGRLRSIQKNSAAIIIVFKLTSRDSFQSVSGWARDIQENSDQGVVISLVGNMTDLEAERSVSNEEGKQKAQEINSLYFETSAAIGKNIDDIFINTLEKVTKQINPIRTDCEQNVRDSIHLSQKYQSQPKINQENNGGIKPKQTESPKKGCC
uniref:Rab_C59 protein n=1 Tax=Paramecium tetraurelia TaxID=5888 RepID=Q3SD78_PARTE|nr:rab_C59 [Paramecium tetraurelia]